MRKGAAHRAARQQALTSFGVAVRAYRLGFGWLAELGCWVRISGPEHGLITLECATDDYLPRAPEPADRMHRIWWAHPGGPADASALLRGLGLRHVKTAVSFTIDGNGRRVQF